MGKFIDASDIQKIIALYEQGNSVRSVLKQTKHSWRVVAKHLKGKLRKVTKLGNKELQDIIKFYKEGKSAREIASQTGYPKSFIRKSLDGHMRSVSEATSLARATGRYKLSEQGRMKLSEAARERIRNSRKVWTKPERMFKDILNSENIGVKFPDYMKEIFGVQDDCIPGILAQYPIQRYVCDFVDLEHMTVYRINGDFWHANPLLYDPKTLTKIQENNIRHDKSGRSYLEGKGFNVVDIWQSEIEWNKELVVSKIRNARGINKNALSIAVELDWSDKIKKLWFKERKRKNPVIRVLNCILCGRQYSIHGTYASQKRKYCSTQCVHTALKSTKKPSRERLYDLIVKKTPWTHIGIIFGVTDTAIKKWAKSYGILPKPRPYKRVIKQSLDN